MPCVARHMPGQGSERGLVTYSASLSYDVINDRYATPSPTPCGRRSRLKPQRSGRRGGPPHLRRAEGHGPAPLPPRRRQRDRHPRRRSHHRRARATAKATPTCASARPCAAVPGATPPGGPPRAGPRAPRPTARWPRGRVCARRHQEDGRGGSGSPLPRPRPRREGLRDRQAGRQGPARLRPDGGDPRGAPARVPRGHCGGQDDVGRAGLAQDLARGRVDARGPARATRDRARRAAGHHRAREEDERGARGLRDQVPGHHQAASCEPRKCRELRLTPSWARTLATATAISAS